MYLCRGDSTDPVCERGDAVHKNPETRKCGGGLHDTTESQRHSEEQGDDCTGGFGIREGGDNHVCEGGGVDEELDAEDEDEALLGGGLDSDDGVVVASPDEDAHHNLVGDFDDDVGDEEGLPGVGLAGAFADFVEGALGYEEGHDLVLLTL